MVNISIQMTRLHAFDFTRGILTFVFFAPALTEYTYSTVFPSKGNYSQSIGVPKPQGKRCQSVNPRSKGIAPKEEKYVSLQSFADMPRPCDDSSVANTPAG